MAAVREESSLPNAVAGGRSAATLCLSRPYERSFGLRLMTRPVFLPPRNLDNHERARNNAGRADVAEVGLVVTRSSMCGGKRFL